MQSKVLERIADREFTLKKQNKMTYLYTSQSLIKERNILEWDEKQLQCIHNFIYKHNF